MAATKREIIVTPDKFKGSLSQAEVCEAVTRFLDNRGFTYRILPLADGGDGTIETLISLGWKTQTIHVNGPTMKSHEARIAFSPDDKILCIELAEICGIKYLDGIRDPFGATSYAIGQALFQLHKLKWRELWLAVGGSASTDGGVGILQGIGSPPLDRSGNPLAPGLKGLVKFERFGEDPRISLQRILRGRKVILISDVDSPLLGRAGTVATFGPQKGIRRRHRFRSERALKRWSQAITNLVGRDYSMESGAGSAGGVGFFALALMKAEFKRGSAFITSLVGVRNALHSRALVITGEGRIDQSTLAGKAIMPILNEARSAGARIVLICGSYDAGTVEALSEEYPIESVISLEDNRIEDIERFKEAASLLYDALNESFQESWLGI